MPKYANESGVGPRRWRTAQVDFQPLCWLAHRALCPLLDARFKRIFTNWNIFREGGQGSELPVNHVIGEMAE